MKTSELLKEYKQLFDSGAITEEEFAFIKKELMDQGDKEHLSLSEEKEKADSEREKKKTERGEKGVLIGCAIIMIVIVVFVLKGCVWLFSDLGSENGNYTTYYQDDNGNGKLDQGEWNYTEDDDGNVVDVDDDGSNWE